MQIEFEIQRLRWQCRRGLLELDYILQHYLDHHFAAAQHLERAQFILLLQQQDDNLQAWLLEGVQPAADLSAIVERLRQEPVTTAR